MSDLFPTAAPLAPLIWAVAQVTAVTAAACVAERLARRAGPRAGGTAALAGLAAAGALSLAVFSPWPRWEAAEPVAVVERAEPIADAPPVVPATSPALPSVTLAGARAFAAGLLDPPREAPKAEVRPDLGFGGETRRPVRWGLLLAGALLAAGLARFALGWLLVARLRRRAVAVTDDAALAECARLAAAAGVRGGVDLLETPDLATAAAVGSRRPAVLLPAGWRGWSDADRGAVLAHELAHVAAGDFGRNLLAQSLLLAQFYHPLAHWLAGRVRADQELAADAAAAGLCGGRQPYLRSLAAVALAADPGPPVPRLPATALWPARAFLPTRRSLHERVEMLRKPPVPRSRRAKLAGPLATAGVLCVAGLASGFRPAPAAEPIPAAPAPDPVQVVAPVQGEPDAKPQAASADAEVPDVLAYVPADADLIAVAEVKKLLAAPALAPLAGVLTGPNGPDGDVRETFGVGIRDVERVAMYQANLGEGASRPVWVVRTVGPAPNPPTLTPPPGPAAGLPSGERPRIIVRADARTLVFSPGGLPTGAATAGSIPAPFADGGRLGYGTFGGSVRAFVDLAGLRTLMLRGIDREISRGGDFSTVGFLGLVRPLAANVDDVTLSVEVQENTARLAVFAGTADPAAAATVEATVRAALTLALNAVSGLAAGGGPPEQALTRAMLAGTARQVLEATTASHEGNLFSLYTTADATLLGAGAAALLPATMAARQAAQRSQSQNNLKQIALAMHNYHSTYRHFPPAVIVENGVKRSWRVELLPYLDEPVLARAYRKDEPWDSLENKQVLARMPAVFRHPADDRAEPYAAYFAVVAENAEKSSGRFGGATAWLAEGPRGKGTGLTEVRDGTVDTILAVESKRPVPWTKPEDITYDAAEEFREAPEPRIAAWAAALKLGGFTPGQFQVAFADGSVRAIGDSIDSGSLRAMLTRNGGEVIERDRIPSGAER